MDPSDTGNPSIGQFAMIPLWVERRLRGESVALHVWVRLAVKYADREGRAYPKQESLAADLGCSVKTIQRALDVLRDKGVVRTKQLHDAAGYVSGLDYELITIEANSKPLKDTTVLQDKPKGHHSPSGPPPERRHSPSGPPPEGHLSPRLKDTGVPAEKKTRSSTTIYVRTPLTPLAGGLRITKRDLRDAARVRTTWGGCRHDPRCSGYDECLTRIAWMRRREQVTTAEQLAAEETELAEVAHA